MTQIFQQIDPPARFLEEGEEATSVSPPGAATHDGSSRRLRVLVVDDEPFFGTALRRMLAPEHEVIVASGGAAALEAFRAEGLFDVVLCDMMMPEISGPDLYEATRTAFPALLDRFIFMTGGIFTAKVREFLATVSNPVIEKPFSLVAMKTTLADFVEAREKAAR